jgi:hypothetical protein
MKALDQGLCTRIGLWIQSLVLMPVAGEEIFEAQNIRMIRAADDHGTAGSEPEKGDAAEDQGAHDAFAELGLFHQEVAQSARRNEEGLDRLLGISIDQGRAARKLRKLAHERARTVGYDELGMSRRSAPSDVDPACQDNESARCYFAGRDDAIVRRIGFELTEPPEPPDLRRLQHREPLIASGFEKRISRLRHDFPHRQACDNRICLTTSPSPRPAKAARWQGGGSWPRSRWSVAAARSRRKTSPSGIIGSRSATPMGFPGPRLTRQVPLMRGRLRTPLHRKAMFALGFAVILLRKYNVIGHALGERCFGNGTRRTAADRRSCR